MEMTIEHFKWTIHAEERLPQRELTRARVEHAVRELHPLREANQEQPNGASTQAASWS
jgi:hypothetical protein